MHHDIKTAADLGSLCRAKRKALGLKLAEAAMIAGVNYRFASNLENGKPTIQFDLAFQYARSLGLVLHSEEAR